MPVYKYVKKPVVIEAIHYTGSPQNIREVLSFSVNLHYNSTEGLYVNTLEGKLYASVGDYIIKGVRGEVYACKPDIFEETYSFYSPA